MLSPCFFLLYILPQWYPLSYHVAIGRLALLWILFLIIEASDTVDGMIARRQNKISNLGKVLDPLGDVFGHLTFFFCFVIDGIMPTWCFIIILYREIGIIALRLSNALSGIAIAARWSGKLKTVLYFLAGVMGLGYITVDHLIPISSSSKMTLVSIAVGMFVVAVAVALCSFGEYLLRARKGQTA